MKLETLVVEGIRNLQPATLTPRARFNVFVGDNGQGKTNLLESIYAVAALRSFRTSKLAELVAFGAERARLGARVVKDDLVRVYEVELAGGTKRVKLDGKAVRPLARYFGSFNVVVFTPEDLALPRGAPAARRRFLDRGAFNLDAGYLATASDYDKVVKTRTRVLRQVAQASIGVGQANQLLDVYDEQLAQLAVAMVSARTRFLEAIQPELTRAFSSITRTGLAASVSYESSLAGQSSAEIVQRLRDGRARDLAAQSTLIGPHRDDLAFALEGREAGSFASQGQLRAIMLAWKTAELATLARVHGDLPILLLDDVSSELDEDRNRFLFEHLTTLAGQCFITTTHADFVLVPGDRADYRIRAGQILD
ncbi:MAG: DNA replication/repair protein RecF [Kofleriaceae bacterium]